MHYSYKYMKWGRLQRLHAVYNDGSVAFSKEEKFHDTSRLALGRLIMSMINSPYVRVLL